MKLHLVHCVIGALALSWLAAAPLAAQEGAQAEAQRHFERGEALFERGDYDAALAEYERSYALLDGHPDAYVLLFNIGQAYERSHRYDRALEYYRRYLEEGGEAAEDRAAVQSRVETLEGLLGQVRIRANVSDAEVWVDDHRVGAALESVRVTGGRHVVELRLAGYASARAEVQVAAGQTVEVELSLVRQVEGIAPGYFWVTTGAAAAALIAGAVLGSVTLAERASLDARLAAEDFTLLAEVEAPRMRALALATDITFGAGAVLAVAAAILGALTDWTDGPAEERASIRVAPTAGVDHLGLVIGGDL